MADPTDAPSADAQATDIPPVSAQPSPGFTSPAPNAAPVPERATGVLTALEHSLRWLGTQLAKPRVRTVLVGTALIIIAALWISHSVWTFPLVIVGILMIIVAWVGSRLEGRFAIEWSEAGAGFEMRARVKAPQPEPRHALALARLAPEVNPEPVLAQNDAPEVIEGEAHTIEIDVAELRALVEAAERAVASTTTNGTPVSWQETSPGADRSTEH